MLPARLLAVPTFSKRYVLLTHAEDPVGLYGGVRLMWERPSWLRLGHRHVRVPGHMLWLRAITYLQVLFDVKNSTIHSPEAQARAHDYRGALPRLLQVASAIGT